MTTAVIYESRADRENESSLIAAVCKKLDCDAFKLQKEYRVDYAVTRGKDLRVVAYVECKERTCDESVPFLILDAAKYWQGKQLSAVSKVPFVLMVRFITGAIRWIRLDDKTFDTHVGGRTDRGDARDIEPVIRIYTNSMMELS
jgi:hypothetical protein